MTKKGKKIRCLFILGWLCSFPFYAQDVQSDSVKKKIPLVEFISKRRNFIVAPQLDRSPETGFLTGIYYLQLFKTKKDSSARTSNVETFLSITEKQQYIAEVNPVLLFHKEKYIFRAFNIFTRYNEYFYGIGNGINVKERDLIEFNHFNTTNRLVRVVNKRFFAGILYQFYKTWDIHYPLGGLLDKYTAIGKNGSQTSGIGPVFLYDSRDNVINSYKGFYLDVSALFVRKEFGGDHAFTNLTIDARKFIRFYKNNIVCFQGMVNFNWGDVPFRQLGLLGSDILMRGYYQGTYREHFMTAFQTEFRIPVWRFLGIVLFGAAGQVQNELKYFNWEEVRFTYGFGVRIMFIKHERVNVCSDIGFGKGTKAFYLGSGESF